MLPPVVVVSLLIYQWENLDRDHLQLRRTQIGNQKGDNIRNTKGPRKKMDDPKKETARTQEEEQRGHWGLQTDQKPVASPLLGQSQEKPR